MMAAVLPALERIPMPQSAYQPPRLSFPAKAGNLVFRGVRGYWVARFRGDDNTTVW
jgi:hypothetical protein